MNIKHIRERIESEHITSEVGIGVFWLWALDNANMPYPKKAFHTQLRNLSDEDLQEAWTRFMIEASDDEREAVLLTSDEHEYDKDCGCEACKDYARAEAEYYAEMKEDR